MNNTKLNRKRKKQVGDTNRRKLIKITYVTRIANEDGTTSKVKSKVDRKFVDSRNTNPPCLQQHLVKPLS